MPDQRMLHPEQSLSRKVTALSDFDYRVWEQTKLSSDDFGVMSFSAAVLRAQNLRLRKATEGQVFQALERLVAAELLLPFDHQGEPYVCAPVWQTWQTIVYPRKTHLPRPDAHTLSRCNEDTQSLFARHPGGKKPKKTSGRIPGSFQNDSGKVFEPFPESIENDAGMGSHAVPANANANANADANAREGGGETHAVGPGGGAGRRRPSLLTNPVDWERQHRGHADGFCDWVCLPGNVFQEFINRVIAAGATEAAARDQVLAWARSVRRDWAGAIAGDDIFAFWRHEWAKTHGSNRPSSTPSGDNLAGLRQAVGRG